MQILNLLHGRFKMSFACWMLMVGQKDFISMMTVYCMLIRVGVS